MEPLLTWNDCSDVSALFRNNGPRGETQRFSGQRVDSNIYNLQPWKSRKGHLDLPSRETITYPTWAKRNIIEGICPRNEMNVTN